MDKQVEVRQYLMATLPVWYAENTAEENRMFLSVFSYYVVEQDRSYKEAKSLTEKKLGYHEPNSSWVDYAIIWPFVLFIVLIIGGLSC